MEGAGGANDKKNLRKLSIEAFQEVIGRRIIHLFSDCGYLQDIAKLVRQ